MKILWLTPKWTLPANDGARVASYQLLKYLPKENIEIDYLALSHPDDTEDRESLIRELGVKKASFIKRELPQSLVSKIFFYGTALLRKPSLPLTMSSLESSKIKRGIKEILENNSYDYIVADGLHCVTPIRHLLNEQNIIYRAHNVENDIWKRAAAQTINPFKKLVLLFQYYMVKRFEINVLNQANKVYAISEDDAEVFKKISAPKKLLVTPIGMRFNRKPQAEKFEKTQYLFLGRLDWPPNKDGLKWLLDEVYPHVDKSKAHLHIAGSGDRSWLEPYHNREGYTFHGYVKSIEKLYSKIDCALIPIQYGSGTRIKVIEACAYAKPIISTKMGALGSSLTPDRDYQNCETSDEWIISLNNYDDKKQQERLQKATEKLKKQFDQNQVAHEFAQSLS